MAHRDGRIGVLLVNLGTPDSPAPADVRRYLAEFLSDPRVLTMPGPVRWLLLHGVILRVRPRKSAEAYEKVWMPEGSPLLVHGRAHHASVATALGDGYAVSLGMRYGRPSIDDALAELTEAGVSRIIVLPLFPQFSEAVTGSIFARVRERAARLDPRPALLEISDFHADPGFIAALAAAARPTLDAARPDHVLLSYHGLPESQIKAVPGCLEQYGCCDSPGARLPRCYRAQCFGTSRALARALDLAPDRYTVAFQSRVGLNKWIGPFTDEVLEPLRAQGVSRLAVLCPAFVADCLETIEEIGIRLREQWAGLGGEAFALAPCVNASPAWVEATAALVRGASEQAAAA